MTKLNTTDLSILKEAQNCLSKNPALSGKALIDSRILDDWYKKYSDLYGWETLIEYVNENNFCLLKDFLSFKIAQMLQMELVHPEEVAPFVSTCTIAQYYFLLTGYDLKIPKEKLPDFGFSIAELLEWGRIKKRNDYYYKLDSLRINSLNGIETLQDIDTIVTFHLKYNKLTSLPPDAFLNLKSLKHLDLSHNNISTIQTGAFNGLSSLEYLDLGSNKLTAFDLEVFAGLENLTTLSLSYNPITTLTSSLKALTTLSESFPFKPLPKIETIKLYDLPLIECEIALKILYKDKIDLIFDYYWD